MNMLPGVEFDRDLIGATLDPARRKGRLPSPESLGILEIHGRLITMVRSVGLAVF